MSLIQFKFRRFFDSCVDVGSIDINDIARLTLMLDYLFQFEESVDQFLTVVQNEGLTYAIGKEPIDESTVISIEEPIADEVWDKLDDLYDELEVKERERLEAESPDAMSESALYIDLKDGKQTIASVDPELINRILGVISIQELNDFIHQIAISVEEPDTRSMCQRDQ